MNEELILRVMSENGMTRDQAIALIMGNQNTLNPVEAQFSSSYTGVPTDANIFQVNYTPSNIGTPTNYLNNNSIPSVEASSFTNSINQIPVGELPMRQPNE